MPAQFSKKIGKLALIVFLFLFLTGSCATLDKLDKFIDDFGRPAPGIEPDAPPQPAKKVPLPPTIKDFESRTPDS